MPRGRPVFWREVLGLRPAARRWLAGVALALVLLIGAADFWSGFEISWLTFYLLPVCLAVVVGGRWFGAVVALFSVGTWLAGDVAAGAQFANPLTPAWNAAIALGAYLVVVALLSGLLALHRELEERVRQRTAALSDEIAERERLEKLIVEIGERERRSLGHDLHDGLGQHLTGTSLTGQVLAEKLQARNAGEAAEARRLVALIAEAIEQTRRLSKGLVLADIGPDGLAAALQELAATAGGTAQVACDVRAACGLQLDEGRATHLYRIAQEALSNALRHGRARRVDIALTVEAGAVALTVRDDGVGLPPPAARGRGLGLRIMAHRAAIVGATLSFDTPPGGGTMVICRLPSPTP